MYILKLEEVKGPFLNVSQYAMDDPPLLWRQLLTHLISHFIL